MPVQDYPPVLGPSLKQQQLQLFGGEDVDPSEFRTPEFSEAFIDKYGKPVQWFRAWEKLMKVTVDKECVPQYASSFATVSKTISFLDFCKHSDQLAREKGRQVLTRKELEGAWVQELVFKFDHEKEADVLDLVGRFSVNSVEKAKSWMRNALQQAVEKRFSSLGIEEYWLEKQKKFNLTEWDIQKVEDCDYEPMPELEDPEYNDDGGVEENVVVGGNMAFRLKNSLQPMHELEDPEFKNNGGVMEKEMIGGNLVFRLNNSLPTSEIGKK